MNEIRYWPHIWKILAFLLDNDHYENFIPYIKRHFFYDINKLNN